MLQFVTRERFHKMQRALTRNDTPCTATLKLGSSVHKKKLQENGKRTQNERFAAHIISNGTCSDYINMSYKSIGKDR